LSRSAVRSAALIFHRAVVGGAAWTRRRFRYLIIKKQISIDGLEFAVMQTICDKLAPWGWGHVDQYTTQSGTGDQPGGCDRRRVWIA
jgi:hypothetical protein